MSFVSGAGFALVSVGVAAAAGHYAASRAKPTDFLGELPRFAYPAVAGGLSTIVGVGLVVLAPTVGMKFTGAGLLLAGGGSLAALVAWEHYSAAKLQAAKAQETSYLPW